VLGQVQANGSQLRILAHLIRLPDQIHLAVVRTERILDDPLAVQSSVAQKVASEFSTRVSELSARTASPVPATH
jgi:TolB-like protein